MYVFDGIYVTYVRCGMFYMYNNYMVRVACRRLSQVKTNTLPTSLLSAEDMPLHPNSSTSTTATVSTTSATAIEIDTSPPHTANQFSTSPTPITASTAATALSGIGHTGATTTPIRPRQRISGSISIMIHPTPPHTLSGGCQSTDEAARQVSDGHLEALNALSEEIVALREGKKSLGHQVEDLEVKLCKAGLVCAVLCDGWWL